MSMILLFYYVEALRFSDQTWFTVLIHLVHHCKLSVFNKALLNNFFNIERSTPDQFWTQQCSSLV